MSDWRKQVKEEWAEFIEKATEPTESGKPEVDGYRYITLANAIEHFWISHFLKLLKEEQK